MQKGIGKKCTDHLGQEFNSISAMCENWRIPIYAYTRRIHLGWSKKDALETPVKDIKYKCTDHLGQEFPSIRAMLKFWNIAGTTYTKRIAKGWSLKDALETSRGIGNEIKCTDHLGNEFNSMIEMCNFWNIDFATFHSRINRLGWSLKDALETPMGTKNKICTDHLGNQFASKKEMFEYWNISYPTGDNRIKRGGWSLKDALETPVRDNKYADHIGQEFTSEKAMCDYWGISTGRYYYRIKSGWTQKEALEIPSRSLLLDSNLTSMALIEKGFYKVIYKNQVDIWTYDELMYYYRTTNNLKITS